MKVSERANSKTYQIPDYLDKPYFPSLDGLRGIAILIVLISHFGLNYFLKFIHLRIDSRFGVDIFFVLSGFLITTGLLKQKLKKGRLQLSGFYKKRALRILPLVYLYLIVIFMVSVFVKPIAFKDNFFYSMLFLGNLPVPTQPSTAHLWTLAVEWQFYTIFPFLLYWLGIHRFFILSLFIILVLPLLSISYKYLPLQGLYHPFDLLMKLLNYSFWKGPTILLIGSVASLLSFKGFEKFDFSKKYYFLSFFLFLAAFSLNIKDSPLYLKYISQYLSAILIALVILLNLQSENFLSKILCSKVLIKTGVLSYSIYIWQQLFIGGYFWFPGFEWLNILPFAGIILVKFLLILPMAYISHIFYERHFLRLKNKFPKDRTLEF